MKLLSRDEFRESVLKRNGNLCVICRNPAQDAHHIIERRLFDNGGYFLENGAALCAECHILAEQTLVMPDEIRNAANIPNIILPDHFYPDYEYDKWGNVVNSNGTRLKGELFWDESVQKILASGGVLDRFSKYIKYPRTYHLPCSFGRTKDDRVLNDYSIFENKEVVATLKMDGENTTAYWDGYIHARSLDGNNHVSRNWVKNYLQKVIHDLPEGWRICGENVYGKHSISYVNLESYFYLFSIWNEKNECLSWQDTIEWAAMLDLNIVSQLYLGVFNQQVTETLYKPNFGENECEGFVLRNTNSFSYGNFRRNVGKFVRASHVQTNQHWLRTKLVPNGLK